MKKAKRGVDPYPKRVSVGFMGILDNVREAVADLEDATDKELIAYASKRWGGRITKAQFQRAIKIPKDWPYGVEMRNKNWLTPDYFSMLSKHAVAHIYNSWTHMPPVSEQLTMPGSLTNPRLTGARFLLTPGNTYEKAVKAYQPYKETKQVDPDAREAAAQLIVGGERYEPRTKTFVYVNNRLEGNALETIAAMVARAVQLLSQSPGDAKPSS